MLKLITSIASILIILGAINWGIYGIFGIDLVDKFLGGYKKPTGKILYILIGLAGIYTLFYVIFA